MNDCVIKFNGYKVTEAAIKVDVNYKKTEIAPIISGGTERLDDKHFLVWLGVKIDKDEKNDSLVLEAKIQGDFVLSKKIESEKDLQHLLTVNTTAILYPYLRSAVSSLSLIANIPPILLPLINVAAFFEKK